MLATVALGLLNIYHNVMMEYAKASMAKTCMEVADISMDSIIATTNDRLFLSRSKFQKLNIAKGNSA